jgi:hypothetical protein
MASICFSQEQKNNESDAILLAIGGSYGDYQLYNKVKTNYGGIDLGFGIETSTNDIWSAFNWGMTSHMGDYNHLNVSYSVMYRPLKKQLTRFQPFIDFGLGLHAIEKVEKYDYFFAIKPKVGIDLFTQPKFAFSIYASYTTTVFSNNVKGLMYGIGIKRYITTK